MEKNYHYPQNAAESISYELSAQGEISVEKYTLFELLAKPEIENLRVDQRVEILNSWSRDAAHHGHPYTPKVMQTGCRPNIILKESATGEEREFINFGCNDYLNLSYHPAVKAAAHDALDQFGAGSGASGVVIGTTAVHERLQNKIAAFKGCEAAMALPSGYLTNLGVITTLMGSKDLVLFDMYSHASLIDGVVRSNINKVFFDHNNMEHLEFLLKRAKSDYVNKLIVIEGVYSMDGDIAPLDKVYDLAKKYGAMVLVDEAHSVGVIGETGRGVTEHFGLMGKIDLITGTFSKALGSVGGYVTGKRDLIHYLYWANRSFMFATSMYVPGAAGVIAALETVENEPQLLKNLWDNVNYVKAAADRLGLATGTSCSAIVPIILGDENFTMMAYEVLKSNGIFCMPVTYPAVAKGHARLRISITAGHSRQQLDTLIESLTLLSIKMQEVKNTAAVIHA